MGRVSRESLIEQLIDRGHSENSLQDLKWGELNSMLKKENESVDENGNINLEELVEVEEEEDDGPDIPSRYDPEWTNYVLGHLTKREKAEKDGNILPYTVGLRRLTELFMGQIIDTDVHTVQAASPENEKRATVEVHITVDVDGQHIRSSDVADCYIGNTDDPYANHPAATAATKAEGRALKRLLGLNCYTAEELPNELRDRLTQETVGKVTDAQLAHLEHMCRDKLGVNIKKFVAKHRPNCNNISELAHEDMLEFFRILQSYQATETPEELKGYDGTWRSELGVR